MGAETLVAAAEPAVERFRSPGTVIARFTSRSIYKTALIIGYAFAIYAASSFLGFNKTYYTKAARETLARLFGTNAGLQALFGVAHRIDTVRGFVAWRTLGVLTIVGGIWALVAATKRFRGEEEAGRLELFLSGQTTGGKAALNTLAGLGAGLLIVYALTAVVTGIVGNMNKVHLGASETLFFSLALVASIAEFFAVGAFASQIAPTRRRAASIAAGVFGLSFILRAIGDATPSAHWLTNVSPLGWIEHLRPLTGSNPIWLLPIFTFVVVLCTATVYLAGGRDLGASLLPDKDTRRHHTRFLNTPLELALRESRGSILGWLASLAATSIAMGAIAKAAGKAMAASTGTQTFIKSMTQNPVVGATTYIAVVFLMVMAAIMAMAAQAINSMREDEAEGYLDNLLTRPVSRVRWLGGRLLTVVASVFLAGVVTGLFSWFGSESQNTGIALSKMLQAGVNATIPAAFIIGIGALTLGLRPRWTSAVLYTVIGWSFLMEMIGPAIKLNHWVLDTSLLHHVALSPATDPRWSTAGILIGIGVVALVIGAFAFNKRDLAGT